MAHENTVLLSLVHGARCILELRIFGGEDESALVSYVCRNKAPQAWWLNTTEIYSLAGF